ncbi:MAG: hypothetical protein WBN23_11510 [Woeseia sp.]
MAAAARALHAGRGLRLRLLLPKGSAGHVRQMAQRCTVATGVDIALETAAIDEINSALLLHRLTRSADFDIALPATFGIPDLAEAGAAGPLPCRF